MSTLHCALENGADLYVNERQKIRHYRARSTEERRMPNLNFFYFVRCVCKLRYYSYVKHSYDRKSAIYNMMVVFKMLDSVSSARYSSVCNVLRQWSISLIPTYSLPTL